MNVLPLPVRVGVDAVVVTAVLAAGVFVALPRRRANLLLAGYLAFFALNSMGVLAGEFALDRRASYNLLVFKAATGVGFLLAYTAFLGEVLDTSLTRPLRTWPARALLVSGALVIPVLALVDPGSIIVVTGPTTFDSTAAYNIALRVLLTATLLLGLAAALLAVQQAHPGTLARRKAVAFLTAFVVLDIANFLDAVLPIFARSDPDQLGFYVLESGLDILAMGLLVRGLLRDQLFDFDLRLKVGIRGGTLVAIVLAVVVVVGQLVQAYTSTTLGVMAGGFAAGALFLVQQPLERAAERVAQRAMPRTTGTDAYVQFKKLEVYRAAVESALEFDGAITPRERTTLDGLREKLGIESGIAHALERDAGAPAV